MTLTISASRPDWGDAPELDDDSLAQALEQELLMEGTNKKTTQQVSESASHKDANIPQQDTYAARAAKGVTLSESSESSDDEFPGMNRTLYMTEFEREHFHPKNIMPRRPCTAFFNLDDGTTTTKEIFEGLAKDEIPASAVQRASSYYLCQTRISSALCQ